MPPKARTPAPIDRPLSRAYLREFTGWSTAYPPGISDPTSLRIMENLMVNRDGSVRVRPGLRYLSISDLTGTPIQQQVVGTHEPFFLGNGSKAYLFAVRETDDTVGFRVLANTGLGYIVQALTAAGIDFSIPQGVAALRFTAATSYVKYLQIDNKIFALSNAGETMRLFEVGATKSAKKLNAIDRPAWSAGDKLTVVHPTQAWISSGVPISSRTSMLDNPSFETNTEYWVANSSTSFERSTAQAQVGGVASARMGSKPGRTNLMTSPLRGPVAAAGGWTPGGNPAGTVTLSFPGVGFFDEGYMRASFIGGGPGDDGRHYLDSPMMGGVEAGQFYSIGFDLLRTPGPITFGVMRRWFASNGAQIGPDEDVTVSFASPGRPTAALGQAPSGAAFVAVYLFGQRGATESSTTCTFSIRNVVVVLSGATGVGGGSADTSFFDGDSGADYAWAGTPNASASVYHPGLVTRAYGTHMEVSAGQTYTGSAYLRAATTARAFRLDIEWLGSVAQLISTTTGVAAADVNTAWTRITVTGVAPAGATSARLVVISDADVERGEYHYLDSVQFEQAAAAGTYFDGSFPDTSTEQYSWSTGIPHNGDSTVVTYSGPPTVPAAATPTANTLIGSGANTYNFGFFYTFSNEVGESAASQVTVVKAQRGWSQWKWEPGNASAEPNGTSTTDPAVCADQLVAYMPSAVFQSALDQGAIKWNLYMMTWSDQDPVPVTAVKIASRDIPAGASHGSYGWLRMTPQQADASSETAPLPNEATRRNYSTPSSGGQGIVAADRMVMVYDPAEPAVIRWSSNEMGNYSDFSASKGGGYKTLTSGNLFVPAVVKLWQNPQSVDTLTILCLGVDGHSTGYYMAPSQVASQSEAVNIMGFEETTATPGTTSPYGCEVLNNALYHPLDEQLMKSTATNYNINHSSMTDQIQNVWRSLVAKHRIVSSHLDNRIYFLVNNPLGEALEDGCWGNEVWVLDAAQKQGSWSRWLVQGGSLRKFEQGGQVVMSLVRPDGIYYFDDAYASDDYVDDVGLKFNSRSIPWRLETNTQGANRAHDAWAHLQQANISVGNFQGQLRYGVRGHDIHGKPVEVAKIVRDDEAPSADGTTYDLEDNLLVRKDMKEWIFFAGSVTDDEGETLPSIGQLNLVQYRYTPSTVNTGYEFGSVETFEYGRAGNAVDARTTDNGVPMPYIDTGRP